MGVVLKIISIPFVAKIVLENLKKNAFKPYQISLEKVREEQSKLLETKFRKMEKTDIGKKLGIHERMEIQNVPMTDYSFYEPFYQHPSPSTFMHPLQDYVKMKTSGTAGKERWFLYSRKAVTQHFKEIIPQIILGIFHDGEKVILEYGDTLYVNIGPAPFASGITVSMGSKKVPFFNFVPNVNLSYKEKVQYFINNYRKIDAAFMSGSTLISQVMPAIGKPIKLKGFVTQDTPEIEIYRDEIEKFTGTIPKSYFGSTETGICGVPSVQHSMGFFFDWRQGLCEFFPVKKGRVEDDSVGMDEVTVGEVYQLVYTSFPLELTRFKKTDLFKCIAKGDDTVNTDLPIFRFQGRTDKVIALQNFTRITEDELVTVLKDAGVQFMDFTARADSENGLEFISIYLEHMGHMKQKEIEAAVHKQLCITDSDYKDLSDFFDYIPIKIYLVPKGTFAKYLEGKTGSVSKIARVNMDEEDFRRLTELIK